MAGGAGGTEGATGLLLGHEGKTQGGDGVGWVWVSSFPNPLFF